MIPTVVTVSSHQPAQDYYCLREFHESLRRIGVAPIVLGDRDSYRGLISKPKLVRKLLRSGGVNTSHMIFCDCWDLVFARRLEVLMEEYRAFNSPVVFNAEKDCFPRGDLADRFPETGTPYRYLNSGFIVAETEAMLFMLECLDLDNIKDDYQLPSGGWCHSNDQGDFTQLFVNQPLKMVLDTKAQLCNTMSRASLEEFDFGGEHIRNKLTHQFPCVFHANGGGKTGGVMTRVLEKLRL